MPQLFNIYIDESCHLQRDGIQAMALGAVWCPIAQLRTISRRFTEIKRAHGLTSLFEIKWTQVSGGEQAFYLDLIDAFFDEPHLHFRGLLIPDKGKLDHEPFDQSHDDWYYKMCFRLLDPIINPRQAYQVYLDIKDTRSEKKRAKLETVLRTANRDSSQTIIRRIQQVRSHETVAMQLTDLLTGAICYHARGLTTNAAKLAVIKRIRHRGGLSLDRSTWLGATKFNLFRWQPQEEPV